MNLTWDKLKAYMAKELPPPPFGGLFLASVRIVESVHLTERVLYPKSPARARRRAKLGYPQHYANRPARKAYTLPDGSLVMHPAMAQQVRAEVERNRMERLHDATFMENLSRG